MTNNRTSAAPSFLREVPARRLFNHLVGAGEQGGGQIEIERVSTTRMNIGICPSLRRSIKIAKID
jgi:hypothetical protein